GFTPVQPTPATLPLSLPLQAPVGMSTPWPGFGQIPLGASTSVQLGFPLLLQKGADAYSDPADRTNFNGELGVQDVACGATVLVMLARGYGVLDKGKQGTVETYWVPYIGANWPRFGGVGEERRINAVT